MSAPRFDQFIQHLPRRYPSGGAGSGVMPPHPRAEPDLGGAVEVLHAAAELVENTAFDLATKCEPVLVARLITLSAEILAVTRRLDRG